MLYPTNLILFYTYHPFPTMQLPLYIYYAFPPFWFLKWMFQYPAKYNILFLPLTLTVFFSFSNLSIHRLFFLFCIVGRGGGLIAILKLYFCFFQGCILVLKLIFLPPPPFFRIIFFPLTHGLKTGVFDRFLMPAQTSKKFAAAGGAKK